MAFNNNNNIDFNCNDNNFNFIGINNDYIENEIKFMNLIMKKNLDRFKVLSNLIEPDNLYLK